MSYRKLREAYGYTVSQYLADLGFYKDQLGRYRKGDLVVYRSGWLWRAGNVSTGQQADFKDVDEALDWLGY